GPPPAAASFPRSPLSFSQGGYWLHRSHGAAMNMAMRFARILGTGRGHRGHRGHRGGVALALALAALLVAVVPASPAVEGGAVATPLVADPGTSRSYQLFLGDLVRFEVFDNLDLTTTVRITPAGSFAFPLIGEVKIGGKTV